jgi:hypothetical protein
VKASSFKRTHRRKDLRGAQKARRVLGEEEEKTVRKRCGFGKYDRLCTLGVDMGENPSGVCHNNSANTFPGAVPRIKMGQWGCKGGQHLVRCHKNPKIWHSVRGVYIIQGKAGNRKGREHPEGEDVLLSPY